MKVYENILAPQVQFKCKIVINYVCYTLMDSVKQSSVSIPKAVSITIWDFINVIMDHLCVHQSMLVYKEGSDMFGEVVTNSGRGQPRLSWMPAAVAGVTAHPIATTILPHLDNNDSIKLDLATIARIVPYLAMIEQQTNVVCTRCYYSLKRLCLFLVIYLNIFKSTQSWWLTTLFRHPFRITK